MHSNGRENDTLGTMRRIENRLKLILESGPVVSYICAASNGFRIVFMGENVFSLLGYKAHEFIDDPGFRDAHIHPDDAASVREALRAIFKKKRDAREYRMRHRDGSYLWLHDELRLMEGENGSPVEIGGSWFDISKRREAEELLSLTDERFRLITENMMDLVSILDDQGTVLYASPSHSAITGCDAPDLIGRSVFDLVHPGEAPAVRAAFNDLLATRSSTRVEYPAFGNRGKRWFESIASIVSPMEGRVCLVIVNSRDITERKESEEVIVRLNKELRARNSDLESQKLLAEAANRSKTAFLSNISHELTTPLNSIIGFSEVLQDGLSGELNARQKDYVGFIETSGRRLLDILLNLVELAGLEFNDTVLQPGSLIIRDLVLSAAAMFRDEAYKRNITLIHSVKPGANITIEADAAKIKQVLFHLVNNAVKFTPDGGTVAVSAIRKAEYVEIEVADTGIGIEEARIAELFQPFAQLESPFEKRYAGAGVGLFLAKKLVELHGGGIRVHSSPGKGSAFTFTLPVYREDSHES
ncbi:MAG: hybrid sensor histidine kinase/response regulator [Spirochaetes bacterium]|nr:MAG: hybrid sensor histidine kinase/response regulator [Spirochaetota bacterium]